MSDPSILAAAGIPPAARPPRLSAAQRDALLYMCRAHITNYPYAPGYTPRWQPLWWLFARGYLERTDGRQPDSYPECYRPDAVWCDLHLRPTQAGLDLCAAVLDQQRARSALVRAAATTTQPPSR